MNIELRLAVAKTMPELYPNARIDACNGTVFYDHKYLSTPQEVPYFDTSLDTIVPVVQNYIKYNTKENTEMQFFKACEGIFGNLMGVVPLSSFIKNKQPALALCLAFVKAAGIEWENTNE